MFIRRRNAPSPGGPAAPNPTASTPAATTPTTPTSNPAAPTSAAAIPTPAAITPTSNPATPTPAAISPTSNPAGPNPAATSTSTPAALGRATLVLAGVIVAALLTATTGSSAQADDLVTHHEFQVNCTVHHRANDDPIVFPNLPGASHEHSFVGNTTTNAGTTLETLLAPGPGATTCLNPDDLSAYWWPTMFRGDQPIIQTWAQTIYYKSGILDYQAVRPFPPGLRYVVGSPSASQDAFRTAPGAVEGWECGDSFHNWDFPANCPTGTQVNIRYQAPSCWDGVHLDSADHKSHMTYPVNGACPASHPSPVPMLEFKIAFPADGDMSAIRLASGRGYSWHYDFFNAWDPPTLAALVSHCINGGLQCNSRGFDLYKPNRGQILGDNYRLPGRPTI